MNLKHLFILVVASCSTSTLVSADSHKLRSQPSTLGCDKVDVISTHYSITNQNLIYNSDILPQEYLSEQSNNKYSIVTKSQSFEIKELRSGDYQTLVIQDYYFLFPIDIINYELILCDATVESFVVYNILNS